MNAAPVFEMLLTVHYEPFVWIAVFVAAALTMAMFFSLIISVLTGERGL